MNIELVIFAAVMIFILVYLAYERRLDRKLYETREEKYLRMIRDLQNRLTAKDLTGYQFLQDAQRKIPETRIFGSLTDEQEAEIEAVKSGLTAEQISALKEGLAAKVFQPG